MSCYMRALKLKYELKYERAKQKNTYLLPTGIILIKSSHTPRTSQIDRALEQNSLKGFGMSNNSTNTMCSCRGIAVTVSNNMN